MKIAHIFNEVKPKDKAKNKYIDTQPFETNYFKDYTFSTYKDKALKDNDFSKKYYHALSPWDDKDENRDKIISKYDKEKLDRLIDKKVLGDNLLLISGDFWGIQKFIFDGITTSKASKILRSRSAMIQLITYAVVKRVQEEFKNSEALLFGAGKFMILAKNENQERVQKIQEELNSYFLKNFFGQNGFILSTQETTKEKLLNQKESMEDDLNALGEKNEVEKLNKFDLLNIKDDKNICIDLFENSNMDDNSSCKFCNKRLETMLVQQGEKEKACEVCFNQIELGKELTKKRYVSIFTSDKIESKKNIKIITLDKRHYYASFADEESLDSLRGEIFDTYSDEYFDYPKWSLNSYVAKDDLKEIKSFNEYVEDNGKVISSGLMALKADIDKLGDTFRELYKNDFKIFNRLSREVEFFFSDYITSLLKDKKVYTVFAGGDDLFLIGEYREIVTLAKEIRKEFFKFSLEKTTISMGLVMFKPTTPINFVSEMADKAEKRAKSVLKDVDRDKTAKEISKNSLDRDGIDIFGISMKFDEFTDIEDSFEEISSFFEKNRLDTTAFYYRLISFCDMRANLKHRDKDEEIKLENAMWKSKLNYSFRRNVYYRIKDERLKEESLLIQKSIHSLIDKYDEKFKPSLFLKIYKNRDEKKENRDD